MIRLALLAVLVLCPWTTQAQDASQFTVQVFGSNDTEAPSTPVIGTTTPIASSQIDIVWGASTDNFFVSGYVVFRDGLAIATTTVTNYSDTDLTPSTTYSYEVVAFDGFPNYSSSSAAVATTTPGISSVPTTASSVSSAGTRVRTVIDDFSVSTGIATASLDVQTRNVARLEVRIGMTPSYELAYVVGNEFKISHEILLNDLRPDTKYYYEIIAYTPSGGQTALRQGSFVTDSDKSPPPPTNVTNLTASQVGDDAALRYELSSDFPQNGRVRVVRSHLGFPQFINDGLVIYEGLAEGVTDAGVFLTYDEVFYTVFVIDPNGLVSSGAIVRVADSRRPATTLPGGETSDGSIGVTDSSVTESDVDGQGLDVDNSASTTDGTAEQGSAVENLIEGFPGLKDFEIVQGDAVFSFVDKPISLSSDQVFDITVPAAALHGDFKTIVATMSDPNDSSKTFSFLLRRNGDQTAYSAMIAPLKKPGLSNLTVEVFDYDTKVLSRYETTLLFTTPQVASTTSDVWYWRTQAWLWAFLLAVPLLAVIIIWFIFWKHGREDEDNTAI